MATKLSEEKKETSMSSDKKQLTKTGESASNSTPDLRVISASGTSEIVSNTEEDRRQKGIRDPRKTMEECMIIKTIDTRQMDVARQLILRAKTAESKPEGEGTEQKVEEPDFKRELSLGTDRKEGVASPKKQIEEKNKIADDIGSVSTTNHHLMRIIHSLQSALNEMYSPPAIGQLKLLACGILLILGILMVVCFIMANDIYYQLGLHLDYVINSRDRVSSVANVAGFTRTLDLLTCSSSNAPCLDESVMNYDNITNTGIQYLFKDGPMNYTTWVSANLKEYADILKFAQVSLSEAERTFYSNKGPVVNPPQIVVNQIPMVNDLPYSTILDSAHAIDALVIHALRVKAAFDKSVDTWVNDVHESVSFILDNALNSISNSLEESLDALLDETNETANKNVMILMTFLLIASGALILTISIIMPVVVKIRKNKQELLCLFLEIPIKKAKGQLEKCHLFCKMIHGETEVERQDMDEDEKNNQERKFNDETDLLLESDKPQIGAAPVEHSKKRRKFKPYSAEIVSLIIESIVVLLILESFFIYNFLRAQWLTKTVTHLMGEVGSIANRMSANEFYYWIELELISTNGTGDVMNKLVETYVDEFNSKILSDQERFLQIHSDNSPYNREDYKAMFDVMIYSDVCGLIFDAADDVDIVMCQTYMDGVLKKGLNSANVAFWDSLKEIANDFRRSQPRDIHLQNSMLKDSRLTKNHWLLYRYFTKAYNKLQDGLRVSMEDLFAYEKMLLTVIFIICLLMLVLIYILFSKVFVENTKDSLWVTKSLLTIIPPEIILQVSKIRHFVISTSKSMIYGLKGE